MRISRVRLGLIDELKNKDFRDDFFTGQASDELAMSIRSLRKRRGMSQPEFATASGMKQSAVSRIEQAEYLGWSFKTLVKVAKTLDARLRIVLEASEDVLNEYKAQAALEMLQVEEDIPQRESIQIDSTDSDLVTEGYVEPAKMLQSAEVH